MLGIKYNAKRGSLILIIVTVLKFETYVEKYRSGNAMIYSLASLLLSCATKAIKISGMLHKNRHICIGGNITVVKRK